MMKVNGLIAATFAFFHSDGSINLSPIKETVERLIDEGLKGVFVCGSNGEGPNLTIEERMMIAEEYVKVANKRILIFVHVGHTSIHESKKLAAHAASIGADAFSSVAGFYFKGFSLEALVDSMAEIASAAPTLPFYYYHIPAITGAQTDMVEFLKQAEVKIPNFNGLKYTSATIHEFQACLNYKNGKFDILFGYDELLLSALAVGAKGAIGSTYSFAAPIYVDLMNEFQNGNIEAAQKLQYKSVQMILAFCKYAPIPAQRAIMSMMYTPVGPCRLPLKALTENQSNQLKNDLVELSFFDTIANYSKKNTN